MASSSQQDELTSIIQILHLTHHRNKNQHRLAKWWKEFSQLRRQVSKLKTEIDEHITFEKFNSNSKRTIASREKVELRVNFMDEFLMPRCYVAFSAVLADNQYAPLGLLLVAVLAKISKVIGRYRREEMDERRVEVVELGERGDVDFGEALERDRVEGFGKSKEKTDGRGVEDEVRLDKSKKKPGQPVEKAQKEVVEQMPAKRPKKKRKKGDAFDELFDSLI